MKKLSTLKKRRLHLLAQGLTAEAVAEVECKALTSVKSMVQEIKDDLGATNITNAVYIATSNGDIPPHKPI